MNPYQTRAPEGASGVELTVALYDGIIRFMYRAIEAVERGDTGQRRAAVKRAMDIVIHLQATLKMDIGGKPAEALAEFYTAMFALMLQGSQADSREKFQQVIACVRNVRDAWRQVAKDPNAIPDPTRLAAMPVERKQLAIENFDSVPDRAAGSNWSA
jgi:flagellar protein FliS